ncbi:uncharacterized protein FOMMEDRAFT_144509 [Fomitiporia mediterranea MF3/22]|uniref:uncharacterized protein n=1 Tax=Fomitiporia mediterranea (strain MF3/22) TaxID=694068 RepID=UPI0004407D35|nr:uncharacterized protein FOMMEDRAFT_144509 [Fomitiporia mediterranea MF3/22]EJD06481.1 hypothetical protein FOMMEDRAFT_144509 [Fomitiporia mediterranea MF3/22]
MIGLTILIVLGIASIQRACGQVSTASLFPIIDANGGSLQGEVVGTGTDGTTYVLSGSPTNSAPPVTLTLVQDASHVSEFAAESTGSVSAEFHVECGFDSASHGVCTLEQILANGANVTTVFSTDSGTVTIIPVPVSSSGATATTPTSTQSANPTQSSSGAMSHSVNGLVSVLPISLLFGLEYCF